MIPTQFDLEKRVLGRETRCNYRLFLLLIGYFVTDRSRPLRTEGGKISLQGKYSDGQTHIFVSI